MQNVPQLALLLQFLSKAKLMRMLNRTETFVPLIYLLYFHLFESFPISVTFNFCSTGDFLKLADKPKSPSLYDNFRIETDVIEAKSLRFVQQYACAS